MSDWIFVFTRYSTYCYAALMWIGISLIGEGNFVDGIPTVMLSGMFAVKLFFECKD